MRVLFIAWKRIDGLIATYWPDALSVNPPPRLTRSFDGVWGKHITRLWRTPDLVWKEAEGEDLQLYTGRDRLIGTVRRQEYGSGWVAYWGKKQMTFVTLMQAKGWLEWIAKPIWRRE